MDREDRCRLHNFMAPVQLGSARSKGGGGVYTLDSYESSANGQLGFGRNESGSSGGFLAAPEDSSDPVGLGEEGRVDDAETETDRGPLHPANGVRRSEDKEEGHDVAQHYSGE